MPYTVVIADDVTGANDIGIMYTKTGLNSVVYSFNKLDQNMKLEDDVTIIDTNSRFCSYEESYQRVYQATKRFSKEKVIQFFNKQCSVFRGNIGAEFDAMLDALKEESAIVVLGFPDNGRTTINSIHYVNGVKLEDSQFKDDPVHPMMQSNLVEILKAQTKRKVCAIHYKILDQGFEALQTEIRQMKMKFNYIIIDVRNNDDLKLIAGAVKNEKVICGSSALGYYLGLLHKSLNIAVNSTLLEDKCSNQKVLCIAGSLTPQTKSQVEYMKSHNYPVIILDTTKLFSVNECREEMNRILHEYKVSYQENDIVIIHSMNQDADVQRTKALAAQKNIDNNTVSEMVSNTLSKLTKQISDQYKIYKFIICGGDTSASFCSQMNIKGMKVLKEIEPGLPTCQSITHPFYELVLKSGSFGTDKFLELAKIRLIN